MSFQNSIPKFTLLGNGVLVDLLIDCVELYAVFEMLDLEPELISKQILERVHGITES